MDEQFFWDRGRLARPLVAENFALGRKPKISYHSECYFPDGSLFVLVMADFTTHVSFSTAVGVVYGTGIWLLDVPAPTSAIAGGICAIAGMFPDIDSKTSRALQETLYLLAGLICMLVSLRLREFDLNGDLVLFLGAVVFLSTKFLVGAIVTRATVHRGMIHSIPAALIAGILMYLLTAGPVGFRAIKAVALMLGFMSHLILDEVYSVDVRGIRMKKSFGTALKFTSPGKPAKTAWLYAILVGVGCILVFEETWSRKFIGETERWTSEGIKALERYSQATYSESSLEREWEQYQFQLYMMASMFGPSEVGPNLPGQEEYFEDETPNFTRPAFSREPVSRDTFPAYASSSIKPYQSPEQNQKPIDWGSVPTATPRNSIFKSTPHSPTGL